jgi:hypothetical protein
MSATLKGNTVIDDDGNEIGAVICGEHAYEIELLEGVKVNGNTIKKLLREYAATNQPAAAAEAAGQGEEDAQDSAIDAGEPAQDPMMGDKTPAYIRWFKANHTEAEFQAKYGHRKYTL